MDLVFTIATTDTEVYVGSEDLILLKGKNKIRVPIAHDRVNSLSELNDLRKVLHKRIDDVLDASQESYKEEKNKEKKKKKIRVFNCFGEKPEMVDIEVDDD